MSIISTLKPAKITSIKPTVMVIKMLKTLAPAERKLTVLQQHSQAAHAQHFSKKVDPKFFVQTFLGGGVSTPQNPPLTTGLHGRFQFTLLFSDRRLFRSEDIRNQVAKLSEICPKFWCFWATKFSGKGPDFWPNFINSDHNRTRVKIWRRSTERPLRLCSEMKEWMKEVNDSSESEWPGQHNWRSATNIVTHH